jgi:hypothetical protein
MGPNNHAIVLNVSDGGLGFRALRPVEQSSTIRFSFWEDGQQIEASGELVWIDSTKKIGGLSFASLPQADRERIRNWVDRSGSHLSTRAASEPATSRSIETPVSSPDPPQTSVPPAPNFPLPGMDLPPTNQPGFALFGDDARRTGYMWEQEMAIPNWRTRFFRGFLAGVVVSAILAAILFFDYGDTIKGLRNQLNVMLGASPAPQTAPASTPPLTVPPPLVPTGLTPSSNAEPPAASTSLPDSGDNPAPDSAATKATTELPPAIDQVKRPLGNLPLKAADPGAEDLAMAQRYLNDKQGPAGSSAATQFLWSAVQKGNVEAEITLADMYARGDGVMKSCAQSRVLLRAAAKRANSEASPKLAQIIRRGC